MHEQPPFHYAFAVDNLDAARRFYVDVLGCHEGRSSDHWIDFDFFGHQIVAHLCTEKQILKHNPVDGHDVPVPHFGVVLTNKNWKQLAEKLQKNNVEFVIEPCTRFAGKPGEQGTMFFLDPAGNAIEIKTFNNLNNLFRKQSNDD